MPPELIPYLDLYLRVHRPVLHSSVGDDTTGGRLWLCRTGEALSAKSIRRQIEVRTRAAFGKHVWPHLFRDCAVTELVDSAPEQIGIAPDLLGHAELRTTRKHYIQATGMEAHVRVQRMIAARRRAGASKDRLDA